MLKLCKCGCGQVAPIATYTIKSKGYVRGHQVDWVRGHSSRGGGNPKWRGGRAGKGKYAGVRTPDGPERYAYEHRAIAERALGHALPEGAEVHHVNGNRHDNRPANLVICQDRAYHRLLHVRARALKATGNANARQCRICKGWDGPIIIGKDKYKRLGAPYHAECSRARGR